MPIQPKQQPPYYTTTSNGLIVLTDTQIKTLGTTEIELLPPLTNGWYNLIQAIIKIETPTGYTNVAATTAIQLYIGTSNEISSIINAADLLTPTTPDPQYVTLNPVGIISDITGFEAYLESKVLYGPDIINQPLNILALGNTGNFTGGGANNQMTIKLLYNIQTL